MSKHLHPQTGSGIRFSGTDGARFMRAIRLECNAPALVGVGRRTAMDQCASATPRYASVILALNPPRFRVASFAHRPTDVCSERCRNTEMILSVSVECPRLAHPVDASGVAGKEWFDKVTKAPDWCQPVGFDVHQTVTDGRSDGAFISRLADG
jgi:hypothetical protein